MARELILVTGDGCPQCPAMRDRTTAIAAEEGVILTEVRREEPSGAQWLSDVGVMAVPCVIAVDRTADSVTITGVPLVGVVPRQRIRQLLQS